jgi:LPS O-antigen subunit length determinant protein (WzzB/FepE family)
MRTAAPNQPPAHVAPLRRLHRTFWATIAFLIAFTALLSLIADYFMRPAVQAAHVATPPERRELSAVSILLLAILLTMLTLGLLLTFRVRRFFTPNDRK